MIRTIAIWLLLLVLVPAPGQAGIVEVPLAELQGVYSIDVGGVRERATTVELPSRPTAVHSVSFRLSGISNPGITCCYFGAFECHPSGLSLGANMFESYEDYWMANGMTPEVAGAFEWTEKFLYGQTWDFLLDGDAPVTLQAGSVGIPECYHKVFPTVAVTGAALIVDADFPVPVRVDTWGRIKASYR
jgi:hypothetical protein